ncbi:ankyrin repeat domain-containing protein [Roseibium sp. MB-4]
MNEDNKNKNQEMDNIEELLQDDSAVDIVLGALQNDIDQARQALETDANAIHQTDQQGLTALHIAAAKGNLTMVQFLLDRPGVNLSLKDNFNRDPLDVAILSGNQKVIDALFRRVQGLDSDGNKPSGPAVKPV